MKIQNKISNCIYGSMMLLPLVAVLSSCAYSIFNKNAVSDVSNVVTYETNELIDKESFKIGNVYKVNFSNFDSTSANAFTDVKFIAYKVDDEPLYAFEYNGNINLRSTTTNNSLNYYLNGVLVPIQVSKATHYLDTYIVFKTDVYADKYYMFEQSDITSFNTNVLSGIDNRNTFYYATEKVSNDKLFAWSIDTPYFNAFKGFTTFFGLDQDFYPMMLSYWVTVSLVMFGYEVITFMITFARNCIHKFEDKAGGF